MKKIYDGYTTNKATLPTTEVDGFSRSHRKEDNFCSQYTILNPRTRKELVVCRTYATNARHTACLWLNAAPHARGSGSAGGWGYHRESAAVDAAIKAAGIKLASPHFGGKGQGAIETALLAIGRAMGCRKPWLVKAHG